MSSLERKVAVVTGGNSGIGLATARALHANGAKIVITGRDRGTLEEVSRELGHSDPHAGRAITLEKEHFYAITKPF